MGSSVATPQLCDSIDSFYEYVRGRVKTLNPTRQFGGIVQARDWPMKDATLEAPYLLIISDTPVPYAKSVSQSQPNMLFRLSWTWLVQGDNVASNVQAANRGNKYRINMQIVQEMLNGHYPGFCSKQQYSVTDDGAGNPVQVVTPSAPAEYIRWTQPRFIDRNDRTSGVLFCSGNISLSAFAPEINS